MSVIEGLAREFGRLPGVGPKTAQRLVYHLLKGSAEDARRLAAAVLEAVERVHPCPRCGNFAEEELCGVCSNPRRDGSVICVVEEAFEVAAVDLTGGFRAQDTVVGCHITHDDRLRPD